jgi:hypothetical protein
VPGADPADEGRQLSRRGPPPGLRPTAAVCESGSGGGGSDETGWQRLSYGNGAALDWRGGYGYIDIQNPTDLKLHIWGVATNDNYSNGSENLVYRDTSQPGSFDRTIYPHQQLTVFTTGGGGNNYHVNINAEPVQ